MSRFVAGDAAQHLRPHPLDLVALGEGQRRHLVGNGAHCRRHVLGPRRAEASHAHHWPGWRRSRPRCAPCCRSGSSGCRRNCCPAMPPRVHCAEVETSTGYQRPCGRSQALSWSSTTPGWTVTSARSLLKPTTSRRYLETSTTSAWPTVWPHCEVPAPRGRIAALRRAPRRRPGQGRSRRAARPRPPVRSGRSRRRSNSGRARLCRRGLRLMVRLSVSCQRAQSILTSAAATTSGQAWAAQRQALQARR